MELTKINDILAQLENDKSNSRTHILTLAAALIEWMGFPFAENDKPRLLDFQTLKLKESLVPAPITGQEQLYRLTAEGQPIRIRFAVLKKFDKKIVQYLVDNNVGLTSYQASMRGIKQIEGREPYIAQQPYFVHFITTAKYDRLWIVFNDGEQKRILVFRKRLSQTQFIKILPAWHNISARSKSEMAKLFWNSLDVKEVNKEFYKLIKEQFDILIGISKAQNKDFDVSMTKQFAVRLIGRYIFCWFLKEKEIIPEALISSETIEKFKDSYFQTLLSKLYFKTLNAEVTDSARIETITALDELYKNIPYLNGGLFDWHSEDVLFEILDLNAWLIEFVKVLESFDFTVDESSSQYQHVAIDPEMLGRIFENLLASQNPDTEKMANQRKAFGAFYTPREIVDYMVNESLKAYVETRLSPQLAEPDNKVNEPDVAIKGTLFQDIIAEPQPAKYYKAEIAEIGRKRERLKIKIDKLFAPDCFENPFDKDETFKLRKSLSEISVLDPACGSGAFPMGVMLRLMELRQIIGHGHRNNYDLKEEILSKNIFGVDIMPMAIEIARLRAWLSLVLESDYKPADRKNNFGIAALPNLDFKFVCANSLIDSGYDAFLEKSHHNATLYRLDGEIQKLEQLRNSYFDPQGDKNKKEELQKEFLRTRDYIKTEFKSLKKSWNLEDFLSKVDDWNPFDDSPPSSFFSPAWMFGIRTGFDVVIGNPPYGVSIRGEYRNKVVKALGKVPDYEIYYYFIELGWKWSGKNAHCSYIIPNSILYNVYAENYRNKLLENWNIKEILDCTDFDLFEGATVRNIIFLFNSKGPTKKVGYRKSVGIDSFSELIVNPKFELRTNELILFNQNWGLAFKLEKDIVKLIIKVKKNSESLVNYFPHISQGLIAYDKYQGQDEYTIKNRIFHFDKKVRDDLKPWLWGEDVTRYCVNWNKKEWIDYSEGIANPRKKDFFTKPRVLVREITNPSIYAGYTEEELYNDPALIVVLENINLQLKALLSILNSQLASFYHFNNSPKATKGAFPKILVEDIKQFPIAKSFENYQKLFIDRVEKIISLRKKNHDTTSLEKEIDVLVYKLYELTYEEVKIIDKDFWLSEEEYNAIKI